VATGELVWGEEGSENAGDLPGFLMHNQFSRANEWHGKGLRVKNTYKNGKPGPQCLINKSSLNSLSIYWRGHCNSTLTPTTVSTSFFLLKSGGLNAPVSPMLVKKELLHSQSVGCASSLGLQTKLVKVVDASLFDAHKLCLLSLR